MVDIDYFVKSIKLAWVNRYLDTSRGNWKVTFEYFLRHCGNKFLFSCNFKTPDIVCKVTN